MMGENGGSGIAKSIAPYLGVLPTVATGGGPEDVLKSVMMSLAGLGGAGAFGGAGGGAGQQLFPDILKQLMSRQQPQRRRRY